MVPKRDIYAAEFLFDRGSPSYVANSASYRPRMMAGRRDERVGRRSDDIVLSVILPNFNHAPFIAQALTALLAQDRPAEEIIVIDDGSSDDSLAIVRRFACQSSAIRLIASPTNRGVVATLRLGAEEARGRYVYFGASDDWVVPGFFSSAISVLAANPQAGLFCGEALLV